MAFLLASVVLLFIFYTAVIMFYYRGWRVMKDFHISATTLPSAKFSVIIPARNEENNIAALLDSLLAQNYPTELFEIIVVDDHSTDRTAAIVRQYKQVQLLRLQEDGINSFKKKAIETGIGAVKNNWIVCTDADCVVNPGWLLTLSSFISSETLYSWQLR